MNTIFPKLSLDRKDIKWEKHLYDLTPVEKVGNIYLKREDYFAPLGYGGINGAKLRQCIWLVSEYMKTKNPVGIISGTSVKSPQLPMGSAIATHFGLDSVHVIGATKPAIAGKHENVAMATWFGAKFFVNPHIAYNPVLQRKVKQLLEEDKRLKDYFYLEYGITLGHKTNPPERIERFHYLGGEQVRNIPEDVNTLIIPAGSCNSCTSILYGLARHRPKNIKHVWLIGIGPNKLDFVEERLSIIEKVSGVYTKPFTRHYYDSNKIQHKYEDSLETFMGGDNVGDFHYNLHHHDLHGTGYVDYQDEMPFQYEGVEFHPTYEGKVATFIKGEIPKLWNDRALFWIVGSKPRSQSMEKLLGKKLGAIPKQIEEYV